MWQIQLEAPQYPEGLVLRLHANKIGGDVEIIIGLNHYIGMATLHTENFFEFTVLPYVFGAFGLIALILIFIAKRKAVLLFLISYVVFVILAAVDVINLLYKAVTKSNDKLIDLGGIFKFLIDVVKVAWYLLKELGSFLGSILMPMLNGIGSAIGWVAKQFMQFSVVQTVMGWVSSLWGQLVGFWNWLKSKAGIKPDAAPATQPAPPPKDQPNSVFGNGKVNVPAPSGGKGGGKSAAETAKEQAQALKEVKNAILEVTKAYREQASARLDDLNFQLKSLTMSEDQVQLEQNRRDILKEQSDALADLAKKEEEIRENKDLSNKGRQEALALS